MKKADTNTPIVQYSKRKQDTITAEQWDNELFDSLEKKQVNAYYTVSGLSTLLESFRTDNNLDVLYDAKTLSEETKRDTWNKAVEVLEYATITLRSCADMLRA